MNVKVSLLLCLCFTFSVAVSDEELIVRIESLEKRCNEQDIEIRRQSNELATRKKIDEQHTLEILDLQQEIKNLRKSVVNTGQDVQSSLISKLNRQARFVLDGAETVAFHATLSGAVHSHYHINQTVVFDKVMLNMGNGYIATHGLFVSPIDGVYIFSVSIMGISTHDSTMVFIMKNGQEIASAIADGRGAPHDQGSTTIAVHLVTGDKVWVSVERHDDTALWGDSLDSFMGCLITAL
ncbi:Complement C1q-like protein 4 [Mactra antiquata]